MAGHLIHQVFLHCNSSIFLSTGIFWPPKIIERRLQITDEELKILLQYDSTNSHLFNITHTEEEKEKKHKATPNGETKMCMLWDMPGYRKVRLVESSMADKVLEILYL